MISILIALNIPWPLPMIPSFFFLLHPPLNSKLKKHMKIYKSYFFFFSLFFPCHSLSPPTTPQEFYRNEGLQKKKENRLSFVILLQSGTLTNPVANLSEISLAITSITNEDGESGFFSFSLFLFFSFSLFLFFSFSQIILSLSYVSPFLFPTPVILPGGGVDNNPENDEFQYGCGNYLPHIPLVDIMDFQLPFCDTFVLKEWMERDRDRERDNLWI